MRSNGEHQYPPDSSADTQDYRDLRLLSEVENDLQVSQRELSKRLGVALGLTNVLLRNLVKKGYIRANQAGWNRWLYALTPEGFSHKIQLTAGYVRRFLNHYQTVRQTLREEMAPLALHKESRVAIYGAGEFAELVYLGIKEIGIEEIAVFGPNASSGSYFVGMPIQDITALQLEQYDRVLIASLNGSQPVPEQLQSQNGASDKLVVFFAEGRARDGVSCR